MRDRNQPLKKAAERRCTANGAGKSEAITRERRCTLALGLAARKIVATVQPIENDRKVKGWNYLSITPRS